MPIVADNAYGAAILTAVGSREKIAGYRQALASAVLSGDYRSLSPAQVSVIISGLIPGTRYQFDAWIQQAYDEEYTVGIPGYWEPADTKVYTSVDVGIGVGATYDDAKADADEDVEDAPDPASCPTGYSETGSTDNTTYDSKLDTSKRLYETWTSSANGSGSGSTEAAAKADAALGCRLALYARIVLARLQRGQRCHHDQLLDQLQPRPDEHKEDLYGYGQW